MATFRLPIYLGLIPKSGDVWWELSSVALTNDLYPRHVLRFKDTATLIEAVSSFGVPKNYASAPKIVAKIAIGATSGNVRISTALRSIADGESFDPSTDHETVDSGAVAVPATAFLEKEISLTFTAGTFAADELAEFRFRRDGNSANDTAAADLLLLGLWFEYSDT